MIEPRVLRPQSQYGMRAELEELVIKDLLGPVGGPEPEEEIIEDRVRERYLVGMLAPRYLHVTPDELDDVAIGGKDSFDEGSTDRGTVQSDTMFPSSMGLSFTVDGDVSILQVTAR